MPLISVVMPVFNAALTLGRAINSTLIALPSDGELIIVNDGSSDSSLEISEHARRRDSRIKIIDLGSNNGIVSALNVGFAGADCRYLARMDADDICLPWRLQYSMASLRADKTDIAFTSVVSFSSYARIRPAVPIGISAKAMGLHLLLVNPVAHSTMVGTRACLEMLGGYRAVPSEDYDLWMRAVAQGIRIARLPVPSQLYRKHPGQITAQEDWQAEAAASTMTASTHRALCQIVLGEDLEAYASLRQGQVQAPEVRQLFASIQRSMEGLNPRDKFVLRRQLRVARSKRLLDSGK